MFSNRSAIKIGRNGAPLYIGTIFINVPSKKPVVNIAGCLHMIKGICLPKNNFEHNRDDMMIRSYWLLALYEI